MDSTDQIGQAVIGGLIVLGYVVNQFQVKSTAKKLSTKTDEAAGQVAGKVEEIHVLVNSQMSVALNRIDELEKEVKRLRKKK